MDGMKLHIHIKKIPFQLNKSFLSNIFCNIQSPKDLSNLKRITEMDVETRIQQMQLSSLVSMVSSPNRLKSQRQPQNHHLGLNRLVSLILWAVEGKASVCSISSLSFTWPLYDTSRVAFAWLYIRDLSDIWRCFNVFTLNEYPWNTQTFLLVDSFFVNIRVHFSVKTTRGKQTFSIIWNKEKSISY